MKTFCKSILRCFLFSGPIFTSVLICIALLILTVMIAVVASSFPLCYELFFGTGSPVTVDLPVFEHSDVKFDLPGSLTLLYEDLPAENMYKVCVDDFLGYFTTSPHCWKFGYHQIICRPQDHEFCLPAGLVYKTGEYYVFGFSIFEITSNATAYFFMDIVSGKYDLRFLTEFSTLSSVWYSVLDCQYAVNILLAWFSLLAIFFFLVICCCCMCCCCRYSCKSEKRFPTEDDETGILLGQRRRMPQDPSVEDFQDSQEEEGFQSDDNSEGTTTEAVETSMLLMQQRRLQEEQDEMGYRDSEEVLSEDDPEGYVTAEDQWEETNTSRPSRAIFPTSGCFVSTYPSLNSVNSIGARSDVMFGSECSLHSGVSGSTRSFLAIEDTNEKVEPPPFARLRPTVFEVVTQEERGNPDGSNVSS